MFNTVVFGKRLDCSLVKPVPLSSQWFLADRTSANIVRSSSIMYEEDVVEVYVASIHFE